jgi:hypothetical protein
LLLGVGAVVRFQYDWRSEGDRAREREMKREIERSRREGREELDHLDQMQRAAVRMLARSGDPACKRLAAAMAPAGCPAGSDETLLRTLDDALTKLGPLTDASSTCSGLATALEATRVRLGCR